MDNLMKLQKTVEDVQTVKNVNSIKNLINSPMENFKKTVQKNLIYLKLKKMFQIQKVKLVKMMILAVYAN
jgi:hypothetical protein